MNEIRVTAQICSSNYAEKRCNDVILIYPRSEVKKLYDNVVIQNSEEGTNSVDYSQFAEFWSYSFGITLSLWFIARSVGEVIAFLKRL